MVKFLVNNAETLSKQEKEGSQKEKTTSGGDSQEGATSEFKKVLDVEKTSEQDEAPQEEVKSLVFVEPELPPAIDTPLPPPLGDGCSNIENIVKPGAKMVLSWLRFQPQDLTYDKLSQDTCCSSQDTCCSSQEDSCSSYESLNGYWGGDSDESWDSDDDSY